MVSKVGEVHLNLDHLENVSPKLEFKGEVHTTLKQAKESVLNHRLRGINAALQTSIGGMYEVLTDNLMPEKRTYTASDFREIGAGVYEAMSPAWDSGSVWTVYSNQDGHVVLSKMEDSNLERIADSDTIVTESSVNHPTMKSATRMKNGEKLIYRRGQTNARGVVVGFDEEFGNYIVQDEATKELDYIPDNTQPYSIDEPQALQKSLQPLPHDETAYNSENPEDAYEYWQQDEETVGNDELLTEDFALTAEVEVFNRFRHAYQSQDLKRFQRLAHTLIASEHPRKEVLIQTLTEDFPNYFMKSFA